MGRQRLRQQRLRDWEKLQGSLKKIYGKKGLNSVSTGERKEREPGVRRIDGLQEKP